MKKLFVRHKDLILKVHASENNTTIFDSPMVHSPSDMSSIIHYIKSEVPETYAINKRGVLGMVHEWRVHNLLYSFGIERNRTKDVDLDYPQKWYHKLLYTILSPFYLNFL